MPGHPPRALVVVLGDLARGPRMLRHARSLSAIGFEVDLLGFVEGDLPSEVTGDARIRVRRIASFDRLRAPRIAFFTLAVALLRQIALAVSLANALARVPRPQVVLMQNPPAFPALPILLLFRAKWRARLIIDWHNMTGAMLRLRLRGRLPFVVRWIDWLEMM